MRLPIWIATATLIIAAHGAALAPAQHAACVVRLEFDARELPLSPEAIDTIVGIGGIGGRVAMENDVLRARIEEDGGIENIMAVTFEPFGPSRPSHLMGRLYVEFYGGDFAVNTQAPAVLHGIASALEAELRRIGTADRAHLEQQVAELEAALQSKLEQLRTVNARRQELCAQAGRAELTREVVATELTRWRERARDERFELEISEAQREALLEQIERISAEVEGVVAEDPITREFRKLLEIRTQQLDRVQVLVEQRSAAEAELLEVQQQVAIARAELAQRQEQVAERAGGARLHDLNGELLALAVDTAEMHHHVAQAEQQVADMEQRNILALADVYETEVRAQLGHAQRAYAETLEALERAREQLRSYQMPTLTVIGGGA
jgi:hypothetical protein